LLSPSPLRSRSRRTPDDLLPRSSVS
jgi:hypothetical protein